MNPDLPHLGGPVVPSAKPGEGPKSSFLPLVPQRGSVGLSTAEQEEPRLWGLGVLESETHETTAFTH